MANLKSFKEVLEVVIKDNTVKVIEVLDQELTMHAKQNVVNKINDLYANSIDNGQMELEFEEVEKQNSRPGIHDESFTITLEQFKDWHGQKNLTENIKFLYGDDAKFCACI